MTSYDSIDTTDYSLLDWNLYKKNITNVSNIDILKKNMNLIYDKHKKKALFFDKLINEKRELIKKFENDIQELIKEKSNIFDIEKSFMMQCIKEENKINFKKLTDELKIQSEKPVMFIENYDKPVIHEVHEDDLNQFGHASEICIEELNNAKYLNIKVSIGDIIDTTRHRHYGFTFVGPDLSLVNTIREDALEIESGITVPLSISRNFRDTIKKFKDFQIEGCIAAFELPYWDRTVKKYNVPRNSNYLYNYHIDYDNFDYVSLNEESFWCLDAIPIYEHLKLKRFEKAELRNIDESLIDTLKDGDESESDYEDNVE